MGCAGLGFPSLMFRLSNQCGPFLSVKFGLPQLQKRKGLFFYMGPGLTLSMSQIRFKGPINRFPIDLVENPRHSYRIVVEHHTVGSFDRLMKELQKQRSLIFCFFVNKRECLCSFPPSTCHVVVKVEMVEGWEQSLLLLLPLWKSPEAFLS